MQWAPRVAQWIFWAWCCLLASTPQGTQRAHTPRAYPQQKFPGTAFGRPDAAQDAQACMGHAHDPFDPSSAARGSSPLAALQSSA